MKFEWNVLLLPVIASAKLRISVLSLTLRVGATGCNLKALSML
jgi:hypothetical protein